MAIAFEWSATIMTISAEMVVPGLLGYWLDQRLGTRLVFLLLGFALGGTLAAFGLMRIVQRQTKTDVGQGDDRHRK
jgi:F0F1-type ATP synthase assembly protein I